MKEDGSADGEDHPLDGVDDGSGCAEIWERLSDRRRDDRQGENE